MNEQAAVIKAVKTATFKLHNPSRRKRAMLDYALLHNHLAYSKVLFKLQPLIEQSVKNELDKREKEKSLSTKEQKSAHRGRKIQRNIAIYKEIIKILLPLPIPSCAKTAKSIPGDIIGQIESHIELHDKQDSVGLPTVQRLNEYQSLYEKSLDQLANSITLEDENLSRDEITRHLNNGKCRPLLFPANRYKDGFLLLKDDTKNRYFVWLNLVPSKSRFFNLTKTESQPVSSRNVRDLINMRTGEVVSFRSKTGCLFPIEFGRDYQDEAFLSCGSPLSAKLLKKDDRYEVHITFEYETTRVETQTYLGVDRGIYNLASLSVIDDSGKIIDRKNVDGRGLRFVQKRLERRQRKLQRRGKQFSGRQKLHAADEAVHCAANEIVDMAKKFSSQVIMENLSNLSTAKGKRKKSNFNRVLNRSQYQKLQKVLSYKLAVEGLPKIREVHPGYTSQACPICGNISSENREKIPTHDGFKMDVFRCVKCDHRDDSDLNAARNIALKKKWRDNLSPNLRSKLFREVPENHSFAYFLRVHAERRGESACDLRIGTFGRSDLDGQYEDGEAPPSGNAVQPRSGSNTPVKKNSSSTQAMVSPSDENSRSEIAKNGDPPDG